MTAPIKISVFPNLGSRFWITAPTICAGAKTTANSGENEMEPAVAPSVAATTAKQRVEEE